MKSKEQKRKEAEVRQAEYDKLTTAQKIARANKAQGNSKRELARLEAIAEKEKSRGKK